MSIDPEEILGIELNDSCDNSITMSSIAFPSYKISAGLIPNPEHKWARHSDSKGVAAGYDEGKHNSYSTESSTSLIILAVKIPLYFVLNITVPTTPGPFCVLTNFELNKPCSKRACAAATVA